MIPVSHNRGGQQVDTASSQGQAVVEAWSGVSALQSQQSS